MTRTNTSKTPRLSDEDRGVLVLLQDAHRQFGIGLGAEFVRAMDVGRDRGVHAAIARLIKHGLAIARARPNQNPWNSEFGSSRRSLKYKISECGLNYLSRSKEGAR